MTAWRLPVAAAIVLSCAQASAQGLPDGFVHLSAVAPGIVQDIRYSGALNFLGRPAAGYDAAECILTKQAAAALAKVQAGLEAEGLTLVVFDCYRPMAAVDDFVGWARQGGPVDSRWHPKVERGDLVSEGYIGANSSHARGSTVDVAIASKAGNTATDPDCGATAQAMLDFGTGFDCFDERSRTAYAPLAGEAAANRRLLVERMKQAGFRNYSREWWHFTLTDEPFPKTQFDFPVTAGP